MAHITPDLVRELDAAGADHAIVVRGDRAAVEVAARYCRRLVLDDEPDRWTDDGAGYILYSSPELAEEPEEYSEYDDEDDEDDEDDDEYDDEDEENLTDDAAEEIAARLSRIEVPDMAPLTGTEIVGAILGVDQADMPGYVDGECMYCGCDLDESGMCWQCDPH